MRVVGVRLHYSNEVPNMGEMAEFPLHVRLFMKGYRWRRIDPVPSAHILTHAGPPTRSDFGAPGVSSDDAREALEGS